MKTVIRILVADDHAMLRTALCDCLRREPDFDIVAEAGDGRAVVELAERHRPDVIILDIEMPGQEAQTTMIQLREVSPDSRVMILTMHDTSSLLQRFLALDISSFLHKSATRETLVSAIRAANCGDRQVTVFMPRGGLKETPAKQSESTGPLSAREIEVLGHVAAARSNRQIAGMLGITEGTVKRHLRNIFEKLEAVSRIDAVNKANAASLIVATNAEQDYAPLSRSER